MNKRYAPSHWLGFESLLNALSNANETDMPPYPPHNVVTVDDTTSIVQLAVAGFGEDEIDIEWKGDELTIRGERKKADDQIYAVKGIGSRKFCKCFRLGEHIVPRDADYKNGIVSITVERIVPESEKPKKLKLNSKQPEFLQD